jgi:pyruvate,water dikinase
VITDDAPPFAHPKEPHILVAAQILPSWLPELKAAVALISEQGGLTSHAAILARELGIPAIVALPQATQAIQTGQILRLDGSSGRVERILNDEPITTPQRAPSPAALPPLSDKTELWVNVTQPELATDAAQYPVAGVGLLRSEWLLLPSLDQRHPYHWVEQGEGDRLQQRLVDRLRPILAAFAPRPVRYRSLDLRSHEMATLVGAPAIEANPMLGVRGTFSYRHHPHLFDLELAALRQLQREGHHNLQLLLPFVRTVEEFQFCRQRTIAAQLNREAAFQLWIMAEVPSVLFLLPDYQAAGVEGIAIGTNDLTQLMLGIDRDQTALAEAFDEQHPAVRAAIAHLLHQARRLKLPTCLCGLMPSRHPDTIAELIDQGITGISVELGAVADTAAAIAQATQERTAIPDKSPLH